VAATHHLFGAKRHAVTGEIIQPDEVSPRPVGQQAVYTVGG